MASGMSARATTNPASTSPRILLNQTLEKLLLNKLSPSLFYGLTLCSVEISRLQVEKLVLVWGGRHA